MEIYKHPSVYKLRIAAVIIASAAIGAYMLLSSHAATPYASVNADKGSLTGVATTVKSSTADDGQYVQFGSSSSSTTGFPLLGLWNNGTVSASSLGVTQQVYTDYASGTDSTSYSVPSTKYRIMLAVGALTAAQAKTIATNLLAAGQGNALIRPMWEQNQGSWFPAWNEKTLSSAQYISDWITIYNSMKAVAPNLQFIWNPNAGEGNNIAGRTTQDTWPGAQYVNYVGVDIYDYGGYQSAVQQILDFASGHPDSGWPQLSTPLPVAFPEWGLNGSDDTAFMNFMTSTINNSADNVGLQSYFSCGPSDGCTSPNSDISEFTNSLAIYKAAFKNQ